MPGPVPKRASERRRRNTDSNRPTLEKVEGAAAAPELGIPGAHPLVADFYAALTDSVEARYFSKADWQRARIELFYLNSLLTCGDTPGAMAWSTVQAGLAALLVSAADKRRLGIEIQRAAEVDDDEIAAVSMMDTYRARLSS